MANYWDSPDVYKAVNGEEMPDAIRKPRNRQQTPAPGKTYVSWDSLFVLLYQRLEQGYSCADIVRELNGKNYIKSTGTAFMTTDIANQIHKFRRRGILPDECIYS